MASRTSAALEIRKLRKKLRQIENLERKDGDLLDEELLKVFIIHRHNVADTCNDHVKLKEAKNNHLHIHQNLNMRCLIIFVLFNESSKI